MALALTSRNMKTRLSRFAALAIACGPFLAAQTVDDTQLKQVIIFGRHAVRTPIVQNTVLNKFSVLSYPTFAATGQAVITTNGRANETLLGAYFRQWLLQEGLLTGNDKNDNTFAYFRANNTPLIEDTATAFAAGMLPAAVVTINTVTGSDPLFNPVDAGIATMDYNMAVAAVNGRLGGNAESITTAYAAELALFRSVLFNYANGTNPPPAGPAGMADLSAAPINLSAGDSTLPVSAGGLELIDTALDPFIMEYADGMPANQVGWGWLTSGSISQVNRLYDLLLNLEFGTPYLARVQSSNLASHIVQTLVQGATGSVVAGSVGSPTDEIIVLTASNTNIVGLAALWHLDWVAKGYQPNVAALGGALVFELRQSKSTGEYLVRAAYITQTMDQLRNLTPLALAADSAPAAATRRPCPAGDGGCRTRGEPSDRPEAALAESPDNVPVFIPGCSIPNATFDCPLGKFVRVAEQAIDLDSADTMN
jgi:4-phytase / acid phosphatase